MNFLIRKFDINSQEYKISLEIRDEVFRKPQGLSIYDDDLSDDFESEMYAGFLGERMISMAFLKPTENNEGIVRAVIVLDQFRGLGYGKLMMDKIHESARKLGIKKLSLKGRTTAKGFYESLGYETTSQVFDYKGIPHVTMEKEVTK